MLQLAIIVFCFFECPPDYSRKVPGSIPGRVTGDFFRSIRQAHVPGVDSASKNEYQDIPARKGGRYVGVTTLPPSCAECLEIWEP